MTKISVSVLSETTHNEFGAVRDWIGTRKGSSESLEVNLLSLSQGALEDLIGAAEKADYGPLARWLRPLTDSDSDTRIPSFGVAADMIARYLREGKIDGWIYRIESDGYAHPYLVKSIQYSIRGDSETMFLTLLSNSPSLRQTRNGRDDSSQFSQMSVHFAPSDLTKKRPSAALAAAGLFREDAEYKEKYLSRLERFKELHGRSFAKQFSTSPEAEAYDAPWRTKLTTEGKVIFDVHGSQVGEMLAWESSTVFGNEPTPRNRYRDFEPIQLEVPVHTVTRVFDLTSYEYFKVNVMDLIPYEYDKGLKDKLVLRDSHKRLLDVLTSQTVSNRQDIIHGKSAGRIILCQGVPGIGKTLTAEIYSESTGMPLYKVHSGMLGTTAETVRKGLETMFSRARRWKIPILLDEADVFVLERSGDKNHNAIVAEFLRVLEYYEGLIFMTTNRGNEIDDAIQSRCTAVIIYGLPDLLEERLAFQKEAWRVFVSKFGADFTEGNDQAIETLSELYSWAVPRDIKNCLPLAMDLASFEGDRLTVQHVKDAAIYRPLEGGRQ